MRFCVFQEDLSLVEKGMRTCVPARLGLTEKNNLVRPPSISTLRSGVLKGYYPCNQSFHSSFKNLFRGRYTGTKVIINMDKGREIACVHKVILLICRLALKWNQGPSVRTSLEIECRYMSYENEVIGVLLSKPRFHPGLYPLTCIPIPCFLFKKKRIN